MYCTILLKLWINWKEEECVFCWFSVMLIFVWLLLLWHISLQNKICIYVCNSEHRAKSKCGPKHVCCSICSWLTGSLSLSALKIVKSMAPPSGGITECLSEQEGNEGWWLWAVYGSVCVANTAAPSANNCCRRYSWAQAADLIRLGFRPDFSPSFSQQRESNPQCHETCVMLWVHSRVHTETGFLCQTRISGFLLEM